MFSLKNVGDKSYRGNEDYFGMNDGGKSDDLTRGPDVVHELVRTFAAEVLFSRAGVAKGFTTSRERAEDLRGAAEEVEDALYGRVKGYRPTNWWSPEGLGLALAREVGETDPEDQVTRRLLTMALELDRLWDEGVVNARHDTLDSIGGLVARTARLFHPLPESLRRDDLGEGPD